VTAPIVYARAVSSRVRARVVVGAVAAVAAAGVVGVTVLQTEDGAAGEPEVEREPPPLELGLGIRDDEVAEQLREAEQIYDRGERASARRRFEAILAENPDSVEAAVGAAIASWPNGTVAGLEDLAREEPSSGVVRLHLGLAHLAEGRTAAAERAWREAEARDANSPSALRAEDLLHPELAPGRPPFVARFEPVPELEGLPPARQLAGLHRRARLGGAKDWLLLGTAYQRAGRPISAREAFLRALELEPDSLPARVAAAVGRFDKDDPSQTFSRLGPLARGNPRSGVVRYHLGLCLSWLGAVEDARRQLDLAGGGFYGGEAERLLARLEDV
jgi:tetratricopeptide (TPR) repeat protein